jgi:hypothetical protein
MSVAASLGLVPCLLSHFPEADFRTITAESELRQRVAPFLPAEAVSIGRCAETIALTAPFERTQIGFGPVEEAVAPKPLHVEHLFPWIPSPDLRRYVIMQPKLYKNSFKLE